MVFLRLLIEANPSYHSLFVELELSMITQHQLALESIEVVSINKALWVAKQIVLSRSGILQ
jgi:hypothetical protein